MTGEELKTYIRRSGCSFGQIATALGMSQQNFSARLTRQSVKSDFVEQVQNVINEYHGAVDSAKCQLLAPRNSQELQDVNAENAILRAENKILKEQNEFLQKMLDRLTYTNNK